MTASDNEKIENGASPQVPAPLTTGRAPTHATLPLDVGGRNRDLVYCDNALGTLVARCGGIGFEYTGWTAAQSREMAAFIVTAANGHHKLVEALKGLGVEHEAPMGWCFDRCAAHGMHKHSPACEAARAALSNLKEE